MKNDTDSWVTLMWYSASPFTFQYFCYQKIQAQNFNIFGWMLKLSPALDSPSLIHAWQHKCVQSWAGGGTGGGLQVRLGWVQGWSWRRGWRGWPERVQGEEGGSQEDGEGRVEGERPRHNGSFWVLAQPWNLAGPAVFGVSPCFPSCLLLPPRKWVFWLLDEDRNAFFSTFLGQPKSVLPVPLRRPKLTLLSWVPYCFMNQHTTMDSPVQLLFI